MIAGVDEAGRGPVIGPLVVAGVKVEDDKDLARIGARDSKKLTPKRREELDVKIREMTAVELQVVPAQEIDILRSEMTLNVLEAKLFATIIERLRPDKAYVDSADVNESTFSNLIKAELGFDLEIVSKHGADDLYPVVSAASIIAKVARDREVERIRAELGQDVGSGYPSDPKTIQFIKDYLKDHGDLPPYTRRSWKTATRLMSEHRTTSLDQF